jgi:hypothetical protein
MIILLIDMCISPLFYNSLIFKIIMKIIKNIFLGILSHIFHLTKMSLSNFSI